ncbi:amino acid deaminase [Duganella aceris]|uniref:amino acid deaminase n=1 Tax=Duganella aceris TaxID=2703883 RepID=UPI001E59C9D0|nr:amino acid deaminase [Duganella aceris]
MKRTALSGAARATSAPLLSLEKQLLHPGVKGLPITAPLPQGAIGAQQWNVLRADTSFPVAVLKISAIQHNLEWMRRFCERHGAQLAPHGKTTMSPQLFSAQLANGAWGITLASVTQAQTAFRYGVRRVLLANQLVAPADIKAAVALMRQDSGFEFFALVDSSAGVARLSQAVTRLGLERPLPLLVELGLAGKRAGCRTMEEALAVAREVAAAPGLELAGIEGYEGLLTSKDQERDHQEVRDFVARLADLLRQADGEGLFTRERILLSAGGSAYFDFVANGFAQVKGLSRPVLPVLRSGCYLTNDHGHYQDMIAKLNAREGVTPEQGLRPALEIWSMVLSRPEPTLAILSMGKRDASYDIDLPRALVWHRPGAAEPGAMPEGCRIEKMNDQHAYLRMPADAAIGAELAVGDLVGCGISHPCTTFDKWPLLLAVDDDYGVRHAINTFF